MKKLLLLSLSLCVMSVYADHHPAPDSTSAANPYMEADRAVVNAMQAKKTEKQTPADSKSGPADDKVFDIADQVPSFPGGTAAMMKFFIKNVNYPAEAMKNGIQGRVIVQFVIEKDGSISNVRVVKGVAPSLDKEAIRVVKSMPRWIPSRKKEAAVRVTYYAPISFKM